MAQKEETACAKVWAQERACQGLRAWSTGQLSRSHTFQLLSWLTEFKNLSLVLQVMDLGHFHLWHLKA